MLLGNPCGFIEALFFSFCNPNPIVVGLAILCVPSLPSRKRIAEIRIPGIGRRLLGILQGLQNCTDRDERDPVVTSPVSGFAMTASYKSFIILLKRLLYGGSDL